MVESNWLEVSLVVDGELAEAVAELLARFAPNGVAIESTAIQANPEDEGEPVGPVRVAAYLPVDAGLEETRHRLEEALWYLGRIQKLPAPAFKMVADTDWAEAWKLHYQPIPIGRSLMVVPAWLENPDQQRIAIRMDPGMAFGTGTHPSTHLCLEAIEAWLNTAGGDKPNGKAPTRVIDVGCGSGILSVAAVKLGASHALAVDTDPLAVKITAENAAANQVEGRIEVGAGSVEQILAGNFSVMQADLVVVNILAPIIIRLFADGLAQLVAPGGALVLAGILDEQVEAVLAAAGEHSLRESNRRQINDWVALQLTFENMG